MWDIVQKEETMAKDLKILLADDEEDMLDVLQDIIQEANIDEDFKVVRANDGLSALKCLGSERYSLVFLDLFMPGMNGEEVITNLRAHPGLNKDTPVVILSGYLKNLSVSQDPETYHDVCFVDKPFMPSKIERMVKIMTAKAVLAKA